MAKSIACWYVPGSHCFDQEQVDLATAVALPGGSQASSATVSATATAAACGANSANLHVEPILVPPGGCVLLHRRLLRTTNCPPAHHAISSNCPLSRATQLGLSVGYGPRWLRPSGPFFVEHALQTPEAKRCPVLRQMLGFHSANITRWTGQPPGIWDLPLLCWMHRQKLPPSLTYAATPGTANLSR